MEPKITVITLGTKDIKKSRLFYESGLGWKASGASNEHFVAFQLQGLIFCLFPEELLAQDATVAPSQMQGFRGITLAHNVGSKDEVKKVIDHAVAAGAKLVKPAQDVFWGGFSGYFADPDGN